ncbi:MAG: methyltransferase [Hyphomicrobiales bacterium]|nr:methyltransferase [Hyphomicrobiales bacterium]
MTNNLDAGCGDPAASGVAIDTTLLDGKLMLRQLRDGHRAGTDAVLLAACVGQTGGTVLDLGAGAGAAGLAIALRNPRCRLVLTEIEPSIAAIARENVSLNGVADRTKVCEVDVLSARAREAAGLGHRCADVLVTNPPYQDARSSRVSPDPLKARAHTFQNGPDGSPAALENWMRACAALLRPGGLFAIVHRADMLGEIVAASSGRFGALQVLPVYPKSGKSAVRVLVRGIAGSRAPLSIRPGLILHEADGAFTREAAAIHAGDALLDF